MPTDEVEGLFTSPGLPEAAAHIVAVIDDLVARYPVDGVHLDYLRYPGPEFDYSLGVLREFRRISSRGCRKPSGAGSILAASATSSR